MNQITQTRWRLLNFKDPKLIKVWWFQHPKQKTNQIKEASVHTEANGREQRATLSRILSGSSSSAQATTPRPSRRRHSSPFQASGTRHRHSSTKPLLPAIPFWIPIHGAAAAEETLKSTWSSGRTAVLPALSTSPPSLIPRREETRRARGEENPSFIELVEGRSRWTKKKLGGMGSLKQRFLWAKREGKERRILLETKRRGYVKGRASENESDGLASRRSARWLSGVGATALRRLYGWRWWWRWGEGGRGPR